MYKIYRTLFSPNTANKLVLIKLENALVKTNFDVIHFKMRNIKQNSKFLNSFLDFKWFEFVLIQNKFQKTKINIFLFVFLFEIKKQISKSFIFQIWFRNWKTKNEKFSKFVLLSNHKTNYKFRTLIQLENWRLSC